MANIFTENAPHDDTTAPQPDLKLQYRLRGIGIGPAYETTYVYVDPPATEDSQAMDADGQWWAFEFQSSGNWSKPHTKKVSEEEVLNATSDGAKEALLIYAERSACDPILNNLPLWPSLKAFVDDDNAIFTAEVEEARAAFAAQQEAGWPSTDGMNEERPALPPRARTPGGADGLPTYEQSAEHHEFIPDVKVEAPDDEQAWVPDPGYAVVSDEEYAANVGYGAGQGRAVSSIGASSSSFGGRGRVLGSGQNLNQKGADGYGDGSGDIKW